MYPKAFAFLFGLGFALAAANSFGAGLPTVTHGAGVPATGTQNGFGRTGTTPPNYNSTFSATPSITTPINTAPPTLGGPIGSPTAGGPVGVRASGGAAPSLGGVNPGANPYPLTTLAPGTVPAPGTAPSLAPGAYPAMRYYDGRWWYPMVAGNWVYWDNANSSWVFFPAATALANNAPLSGQHSSGYRGLNGANQQAKAASPTSAGAWYWHNGRWVWFDGQTFVR